MKARISRKRIKKLVRKLLRVSLLNSESACPRTRNTHGNLKAVPAGYLPLYVGEEMERFVVKAKLLAHPIFLMLLERSAKEYGYDQEGVLHIPCNVTAFERVLESLRLGIELQCFDSILTDQ